jgi:hypothetical protein
MFRCIKCLSESTLKNKYKYIFFISLNNTIVFSLQSFRCVNFPPKNTFWQFILFCYVFVYLNTIWNYETFALISCRDSYFAKNRNFQLFLLFIANLLFIACITLSYYLSHGLWFLTSVNLYIYCNIIYIKVALFLKLENVLNSFRVIQTIAINIRRIRISKFKIVLNSVK